MSDSKPPHALHALIFGGAVAGVSKLNNKENWATNGLIAGALSYAYMYKFGHGPPTFGDNAKDEPDLDDGKIVDQKPAPSTTSTPAPPTSQPAPPTSQPDPTTIAPSDLHTVHNDLHPDDDEDHYNEMVGMYQDAYL
jgi:hypothetical protein